MPWQEGSSKVNSWVFIYSHSESVSLCPSFALSIHERLVHGKQVGADAFWKHIPLNQCGFREPFTLRTKTFAKQF